MITVKVLEESDDLDKVLNRKSKIVKAAVGEASLRLLNKGDKIQLERLVWRRTRAHARASTQRTRFVQGYYICDQPATIASNKLVLFKIPDGKSAVATANAAAAVAADQ